MKKHLSIIAFVFAISFAHNGYSQGWVADITVDLNHSLYAFERIEHVNFSFSGYFASGTSASSSIRFILKGSGTPSGGISVTISGTAYQPYDQTSPYSTSVSGNFSGSYTTGCKVGYFTKQGATSNQQVTVIIKIYPRLQITDPVQECERITLTTSTCYANFVWEVGESPDGNFRTIPGKNEASMSITREELNAFGFSSPFGRKYFRVTGYPGTTSQLQPIEIYYPGPAATLTSTSPRCHNGADGSIRIEVASPNPTLIDDYVITLFKGPQFDPVVQEIINNGSELTLSGLQAGTYRIRIQNNSNIDVYGSCWIDHMAEPLINIAPVEISSFELPDHNGYPISCNGGADGSITAMPVGGTGIYPTFQWSPNVSATNAAHNLTAGTYKVKVQDSNGCWSQESAQTLSAPEKVGVTLISIGGKNGFQVSCHDKKDGTVEAQIVGGVTGYNSTWSTGASGTTLYNVGVGHYSVKVTDANGCTATQSIGLTAPQPIDFSIEELAGIRCTGDNSGVLASRPPGNTIGNVSYLWSSGELEDAIFHKPAGTYSLTVSDEQGCSTTRSHTLVEPTPFTLELLPALNYNGSQIRCYGESNGSVTALVRDDGGNVTTGDFYNWKRNGIGMDSGPSLSTINNLSAGSYQVKVTYNDFCSLEKSVVVDDPSPVEVLIRTASNYNGMPISCFGNADGALDAMASGGTGKIDYLWNNGANVPMTNLLSAGTYVVTATDMNGCSASASKTLAEPPRLEAAISILSDFNGQALRCTNTSDAWLRASASGGTPQFSYKWDSGASAADLIDVPAGQYALMITDANGCTASAQTTIIDPVAVSAVINETSSYNGYGVSCHGTTDGFISAGGSGGTGVYTYQWIESSNSLPSYHRIGAGTYAVEVADQNGCTASTSVLISQPPEITLETSDSKDISCNSGHDGEIILSAQGGTETFLYAIEGHAWQPVSRFHHLAAGTYSLKVKDANGCIQNTTVSLQQPMALSIDFKNILPATCGDPIGQATGVVTGGTGAYSYVWRDQDGKIFSTQPSVKGLASGVYLLNVSDDHFCETSQAVGITSTDGPQIVVDDIVTPSCSYSRDGRASIKIVEGKEPFSILWDNGQTTSIAQNLASGMHLISVVDSDNCKAVGSVSITAPDTLQIALVQKIDPLCHGDCNGKLTVIANGGNGAYQYAWDGATGAEANNLCQGDHAVTVLDSKGCVASATYQLAQPQPLSLDLVSAKMPDCHDGCDGKIEVHASGGTGVLNYAWSTGDTSSVINNICAGDYLITVTDANQCTADETVALSNPEKIELNLGGSITLCAGQTHLLDPVLPFETYAWSGNNGFKSADSRITITEAGLYWLDAVTSKGCAVQDTFLLNTSRDLLNANFLLATEALPGDTVVIIDISWPLPEKIVWTFPRQMERLIDNGEIVFGKFEEAGSYDVSLLATLGECRDDLTKVIRIIEGKGQSETGRLGHESFVKTFSLFPNPNDGVFDVEVEFLHESDVIMTVWNTLTATKIIHVHDSGERSYIKHIDLGPVSAGTYTLRLDHEKGTQYLRFIVR